MSQTQIFIADDEKNIRNIVVSFLHKHNFDVRDFDNGDDLFEAFYVTQTEEHQPKCSLIILDIMMPGSDGLEILKKIRHFSMIPIIIVSAKDTDMDRIRGLRLGCDDYLVKPFSPMELVARVEAILRRTNSVDEPLNPPSTDIAIGDLVIASERKSIQCNQTQFELSSTEFSMLEYLAIHSNRAVSREELLREIWGYDTQIKTRVTDDTLKRIRKKLTTVGSTVRIETIWGYGYIIEAGDDVNEKNDH